MNDVGMKINVKGIGEKHVFDQLFVPSIVSCDKR
jgi:hypothetical protein